MYRPIKTEEEFLETCDFACKLLDYVESISGDNRWWFKIAYKAGDGSYSVIFSSYITDEYKNFVLSIHVTKVNNEYKFEVLKQITDLA